MMSPWAETLSAAGTDLTSLPFEASFRGPKLDPAWKTDLSQGNKIEWTDGGLKFSRGRIHTPTSGGSWGSISSGLKRNCVPTMRQAGSHRSLLWDAGNWCQVSVLPDGMVYTVELIEGIHRETRPVAGEKLPRECVAIELARDCVRYQYRLATTRWTTVRIIRRPELGEASRR